jgi:tRNA A37 threonylcarbamoyladenosine dehydratase
MSERGTDGRFRGFEQLVGSRPFGLVQGASVCVVGLGGVGSWAVEALARSGVGALTLVDLDEVCVTNINRQVQALSSTVGRAKVELLAERIREINPACRVHPLQRFFTATTASGILEGGFDVVLDAIDTVAHKALLIAMCAARDIRVVTVGSGGDRFAAQGVTVTDLSRTEYDPLLQCVRKTLRQRYGFPRGERGRFGVPCVYVPRQRGPRSEQRGEGLCHYEESLEAGRSSRKSCNDGLGSAVHVTGTLGFVAAGEVLRIAMEGPGDVCYPWRAKVPVTEEVGS